MVQLAFCGYVALLERLVAATPLVVVERLVAAALLVAVDKASL